MDTIDTSTVVDAIDIESVHKKVKLNGDSDNAKSIDKNDSGGEEEFDFSSSDLEDLDSVNSAVDEADNFSEPLHSNDNDNQLIEAKNDNINVNGNGDIQSLVDTVVISDTSSLSKCSIPISNEFNGQVDSIVITNGQNCINIATVDVDQHTDDQPTINSSNIDSPSAPTKCEVDDAYSDEDGAIVNFLGKANEIVGLVHNIMTINLCYSCGKTVVLISFMLFKYWVLVVYFSHYYSHYSRFNEKSSF